MGQSVDPQFVGMMLKNEKILGPEIIQRTCEKVNMIHDRLQATQSRQKRYYDIKRKALELEIENKAFLMGCTHERSNEIW